MTQASTKKPGRIKSLLDNYRSLAIVTAFLLIGLGSTAQVRLGVRQQNMSKGITYKELAADSLLRLPHDTLPLLAKDSGSIAIKGNTPYIWTGAKWDTLAGGSGGEIGSAGYGIIKDGTVYKADTAVLTTTLYVDTNTIRGVATIANPLSALIEPSFSTVSAFKGYTRPPVLKTTDRFRFRVGGNVMRSYYFDPTSTATDDSVMVIAPTSGGGRYIMEYDYVDPVWFGATPNDGNDDTWAIQKAVNFAINSNKIKKVFLGTIGVYHVVNLLLLKYVGGQAVTSTVTIEGAMNGIVVGVTFRNTNPNASTIHIQRGYGIQITHIYFDGIGPDVANFKIASDAEWRAAVGGGTIRGNKVSPGQTAISIDNLYGIGAPNSTVLSSADYYPGLSDYYTNAAYEGSTSILITGCPIARMYVGIAEGVSGCPNGEGVIYDGQGMQSVYVANYWVSGQLQSRENIVQNMYLVYGQTFLSNQWGTYLGDLPTANNANVNYVQSVFDAGGGFTNVRFNGGYQEGIWSIGRHRGAGSVIYDRVNITLATFDLGTPTGMAPVILETAGPAKFSNGSIKAGNYHSALTFNCLGVTFDNMSIESGIPFNTSTLTYTDNIHIFNSHYFEAGGNIRLDEGRSNVMLDQALFTNRNESFLLPGGRVKALDQRTFTNIGDKYDKIPINVSLYVGNTVAVNTGTQTLTFTATNPGLLKLYDVIYTPNSLDFTGDAYTASGATLGYVSNITGTTITLSNVPAGVVNTATYLMYILRFPRWVNHTLGTLEVGNNTITNVVADPGTFLVGDRIKGKGITDGTWVTAVTSTTITMSTTATASGTVVELYDAKMKVTADDAPFDYFGGVYNYDNLEVIWFTGDELRNVTKGVTKSGRYCISPGKVSGTVTPQWFTGLGDLYADNGTFGAGAVGLNGNDIQMFGAAHGSFPSQTFFDYGSYPNAINSAAAIHFRTYNATAVTERLRLDKDGLVTFYGLGAGNNLTIGSNPSFGFSEMNSTGRFDINVGGGADLHLGANQVKAHGSVTMVPESGSTTSAATQRNSHRMIFQTQLYNGTGAYDKYAFIRLEPSTASSKKFDWLFRTNSTDGEAGTDAIRIDSSGDVGTYHTKALGSVPTITTGTGAGTGAGASILFGADEAFAISIITGTSPADSGAVVATITFARPFSSAYPIVTDGAVGSNGGLTRLAAFYYLPSNSTIVVKAGRTLAAGTTYQLNIHVRGYQ